MTNGAGWPLGPCALIDLIGVDVHVHASEALHGKLGEARMAPPERLVSMQQAGKLGRKSGRGVLHATRQRAAGAARSATCGSCGWRTCASRQISSALSAWIISSATARIVATEASSTRRSASAWRSCPAAHATASRRATSRRAVRSQRVSSITAASSRPLRTVLPGHVSCQAGDAFLRDGEAGPEVRQQAVDGGVAERGAEVDHARPRRPSRRPASRSTSSPPSGRRRAGSGSARGRSIPGGDAAVRASISMP